ncbi:uncharacterized protein LOC120334308 isoform X2 [Styela clava]
MMYLKICLSQKISGGLKALMTVPTTVVYKLKKELCELAPLINSTENDQPSDGTMLSIFGLDHGSNFASKDKYKTGGYKSKNHKDGCTKEEIENSRNLNLDFILNLDKRSQNALSKLVTELHLALKIGDKLVAMTKLLELQAFLQQLVEGEEYVPKGMLELEQAITYVCNFLYYSEEASQHKEAKIVDNYTSNVKMESGCKELQINTNSEVESNEQIEYNKLEISFLKTPEVETTEKNCNKSDLHIEKFNIDTLLDHFATEKIGTNSKSSMGLKFEDDNFSLPNEDVDMKSCDKDLRINVEDQNITEALDEIEHLVGGSSGVDEFLEDSDLDKADIENIDCEASCYEESMKKGTECSIEQSETVNENYQVRIENLEKTCDLGSSCDNAEVTVENLEETCDLGSSCDNAEVTVENLEETCDPGSSCDNAKVTVENLEETCDLGSSCDNAKVTVENLEETCDIGSSCHNPEVTVENLEETCDLGSSCDNAEVTVKNLEETCDLGSSCDNAEVTVENLEETCDLGSSCDNAEVTVENLEETCVLGSSCHNPEVTVENLEETCVLGSSCHNPKASHDLEWAFNLHPDALCDLGNSHVLEFYAEIGLLRCLAEYDQKLSELRMKYYLEMKNWDGKLFSITWKFSSNLTSDWYWLDPCVDCNGNEGNNGGAKKKNNGQQGEENGVRLGTGGNNIPSGPNQNHPTGDGEDPNEPNRKPKTDRIGGCGNSQENQGARPKEVKTTPFENGETTVNPPNLTSLTSTIPRKRLARPSSLHQLAIPTAELSPPDDVRNPISPTGDSRLDSSNQGFEILEREHSGNIAETSGTQKLGDVQNEVVDFALPLGVPNNPKHFPANPEPLGGATGETKIRVRPSPIVTVQNLIDPRQNIENRARDGQPQITLDTGQEDAVKNVS